MHLLYKLDNLVEGIIIKRPSKYIKTPYVADVKLLDDNFLIENEDINKEINEEKIETINEEKTKEQNIILGHSASLGCCGLADVGSHILLGKKQIKEKSKSKLQCSHVIYLGIVEEKNNRQLIGIYPKLAEILTENALKKNLIKSLQNIKSYRRETKIFVPNKIDSRFDFSGIDENDIPFIMEVKNVPLANYEDMLPKDLKKMNFSQREFNSKIAYFPDGYRKKKQDVVSVRALKHIRELTLIKQESITRTIMCYVIQRDDIDRFTISIIDPEYREAVKYSITQGVEIILLVVKWKENGEAYLLEKDLQLIL